MKKFFFLALILLSVSTTNAQYRGGFRHGNNPEMRSRLKQKIKEELQLTDTQADSVVAINQRYQAMVKAAKEDSSIAEKDREAKVMTLHTERKKELKTMLTEEQIQKLQTMMQYSRKMQEQHQENEEKPD